MATMKASRAPCMPRVATSNRGNVTPVRSVTTRQRPASVWVRRAMDRSASAGAEQHSAVAPPYGGLTRRPRGADLRSRGCPLCGGLTRRPWRVHFPRPHGYHVATLLGRHQGRGFPVPPWPTAPEGAVAQLVRVPDCRSGGCGFESRPPRLKRPFYRGRFLLLGNRWVTSRRPLLRLGLRQSGTA